MNKQRVWRIIIYATIAIACQLFFRYYIAHIYHRSASVILNTFCFYFVFPAIYFSIAAFAASVVAYCFNINISAKIGKILRYFVISCLFLYSIAAVLTGLNVIVMPSVFFVPGFGFAFSFLGILLALAAKKTN